MSYFDPSWYTVLIVDASPVGLAAILSQHSQQNSNQTHIVSFASRLLNEVERRYSHIEKEALAVVWACEKYHIYVYGKDVKIITDNKAVELIYRNPKSNPPARIQRWCLRLSQYNFKIEHQPGKYNPADYLSRNPIDTAPTYSPAEEYVNFLETHLTPATIKFEDIIKATQKDETLQNVIKMVYNQSYSINDDLLI